MTPHFLTGKSFGLRLVSIAVMVLILLVPAQTNATSRIKDIVNVESIRDNMLIGYGLVVGLKGTGDTLGNSPYTDESLIAMLERLGVNTRGGGGINTKNVSAVIVTATLPPFSSQGNKIDVTVSTLGDATSLLGGTLLATPLLAANGDVYAVAQGSVAISGFEAKGSAQTVTRGVPTAGRIASGAIVEKEINFDFNSLERLKLSLKNPDFTTAKRIATSINNRMMEKIADVLDPATVTLRLPRNRDMNTVQLLTDIEQLHVMPDYIAKVVVDERSGIIVMGENVRISTVAIAQGNLTIRVTETQQVSQPNAFSTTGTTEVVDRTNVEVDTNADKKLAVMNGGITLQELVQGLNALGVGPRDMITILQSIKAAGALQADIEVI
ncbi:MAG: flagellar basal body P-ring protein FlgI [Alphaproteobacteria bacterium]|jgi:flagellar P-ring protein precursor FlgI|nr:flagellar basal body P-ring protein FlgI [Alphaproteobacteria bacterium]MBP9877581.1 flagellar basal body P-ring protein FlgI [Alphaproteobacteria bacterium]